MRHIAAAAALTIFLAGALPAQAQVTTWDFSSVLATNQTLAAGACLAGRCGPSSSPAPGGRAMAPQGPTSFAAMAVGRAVPHGVPPVSLGYLPSPSIHQQVLADLIGRIRGQDPQGAQAVQSVFAKYDYDKLYDGIAGPYGLSGNDTGNAMAAYLILGWLIANGQQDLPGGPAAAAAARAQVAGALADSGAVAREKRAELGEEIKLQFVMAHAGWLSSIKERTTRQYADSIASQFQRIYGIDLRRISLDARGLHQ